MTAHSVKLTRAVVVLNSIQLNLQQLLPIKREIKVKQIKVEREEAKLKLGTYVPQQCGWLQCFSHAVR